MGNLPGRRTKMNSRNKGMVELKSRKKTFADVWVEMCGKLDCEQSWSLKSWTHCDFSQHRRVKGVVNLDKTFGHVLLSKKNNKIQSETACSSTSKAGAPVRKTIQCGAEGIRVCLSAAFPQTNLGWHNHACIKMHFFHIFLFSSIMLVLILRKLAGEITHTAGMNKLRSRTALSFILGIKRYR